VDHYIFTGSDLDSATTYLTFNWLSKKRIPVQYVTRDNIEHKVKKFFKHEPNNNKLVYFLNLDTSHISNLIDRKNVVIIDHHPDHIANKDQYKKCRVIFKKYSSCCKLLYSLLFKKFPGTLTDQQKYLILLVDDYESYTFRLNHSYDLGVVYNNMQGEKPVRYYSLYNNGFTGFSDSEKTVLKFYKNSLTKLKQNLQVFTASIPINKTKYKFVSTFVSGYINEISDYLIDRLNADVCLIINLDLKRVTYRKSKMCKLNLKTLSEKLSNGWGYEYAAGGYVTKDVLEFSKLFTPIK
tara:strand:- start:4309 stop:5193 length:885 start_codon:yes stop_codon:yes gene_type:complete